MNPSPKEGRTHGRPPDVTQLLLDWGRGDPAALDQIIPSVYDELRRLARRYLRRERPDHTLQATALVHEAYLNLVDQTQVQWNSRTHFFGIAAHLMRQILVKHAERRRAAKRDGGTRLTLDEAAGLVPEPAVELTALDEALNDLAKIDPRQSRIVELRFFGGLTEEEIAEVIGVSAATVKREWRAAKAWLHHQLRRGGLDNV